MSGSPREEMDPEASINQFARENYPKAIIDQLLMVITNVSSAKMSKMRFYRAKTTRKSLLAGF